MFRKKMIILVVLFVSLFLVACNLEDVETTTTTTEETTTTETTTTTEDIIDENAPIKLGEGGTVEFDLKIGSPTAEQDFDVSDYVDLNGTDSRDMTYVVVNGDPEYLSITQQPEDGIFKVKAIKEGQANFYLVVKKNEVEQFVVDFTANIITSAVVQYESKDDFASFDKMIDYSNLILNQNDTSALPTTDTTGLLLGSDASGYMIYNLLGGESNVSLEYSFLSGDNAFAIKEVVNETPLYRVNVFYSEDSEGDTWISVNYANELIKEVKGDWVRVHLDTEMIPNTAKRLKVSIPRPTEDYTALQLYEPILDYVSVYYYEAVSEIFATYKDDFIDFNKMSEYDNLILNPNDTSALPTTDTTGLVLETNALGYMIYDLFGGKSKVSLEYNFYSGDSQFAVKETVNEVDLYRVNVFYSESDAGDDWIAINFETTECEESKGDFDHIKVVTEDIPNTAKRLKVTIPRPSVDDGFTALQGWEPILDYVQIDYYEDVVVPDYVMKDTFIDFNKMTSYDGLLLNANDTSALPTTDTTGLMLSSTNEGYMMYDLTQGLTTVGIEYLFFSGDLDFAVKEVVNEDVLYRLQIAYSETADGDDWQTVDIANYELKAGTIEAWKLVYIESDEIPETALRLKVTITRPDTNAGQTPLQAFEPILTYLQVLSFDNN